MSKKILVSPILWVRWKYRLGHNNLRPNQFYKAPKIAKTLVILLKKSILILATLRSIPMKLSE